MPLLQYKVQADYDEAIRLRQEVERLQTQLRNFGPGQSIATFNALNSKLQTAQLQLGKLNQSASLAGAQLESGLRQQVGRVASTFGALTGAIQSPIAALTRLAGFGALTGLVSQVANVRTEFQRLETSIDTLLGGGGKGRQLIQDLQQYAMKSPLDFKGITANAQMMLGFGIKAEKILPFMKALGDISMGDNMRFRSLTLAFSQMSAAGKLMGQDLNQMVNAGFQPLDQMAKDTGKTIGELKAEMGKGKITAEMVQQAFINATSEGGKFYGMSDAASKTIGGQLSNLGDAFDQMFNELGTDSEGVMMKVISGAKYAVEHYKEFGGVLVSLAAAFGVYKTSMMLAQAMEAAGTRKEVADEAKRHELVMTYFNEEIKKAEELRRAKEFNAYDVDIRAGLKNGMTDKEGAAQQQMRDARRALRQKRIDQAQREFDAFASRDAEIGSQIEGNVHRTDQIDKALSDGSISSAQKKGLLAERQRLGWEMDKLDQENIANGKLKDEAEQRLNSLKAANVRLSEYEARLAKEQAEAIEKCITLEDVRRQKRLEASKQPVAKPAPPAREENIEVTTTPPKAASQPVAAQPTKMERLGAEASRQAMLPDADAEIANAEADAKAVNTMRADFLTRKLENDRLLHDAVSKGDEVSLRELYAIRADLGKEEALLNEMARQSETRLGQANGRRSDLSVQGAQLGVEDDLAAITKAREELRQLDEDRLQAKKHLEEVGREKSTQSELVLEAKATGDTETAMELNKEGLELDQERVATQKELIAITERRKALLAEINKLEQDDGRDEATEEAEGGNEVLEKAKELKGDLAEADEAGTAAEEGNTLAKTQNNATTQAQTVGQRANTLSTGANTGAKNVNTVSEKTSTLAKIQGGIATAMQTLRTKAHTLATRASTMATEAFTNAVNGLKAAWAANPLGLIIAGVTTLVGVFMSLRDSTEDASEDVKKFGEGAVKIKGDVDTLYAVLESTARTSKVHKDALEELTKTAKDYGVVINDESDTLTQLIDKREELIKAIEREGQARQTANEIARIEASKAEASTSMNESFVEVLKFDDNIGEADAKTIANIMEAEVNMNMAKLRPLLDQYRALEERRRKDEADGKFTSDADLREMGRLKTQLSELTSSGAKEYAKRKGIDLDLSKSNYFWNNDNAYRLGEAISDYAQEVDGATESMATLKKMQADLEAQKPKETVDYDKMNLDQAIKTANDEIKAVKAERDKLEADQRKAWNDELAVQKDVASKKVKTEVDALAKIKKERDAFLHPERGTADVVNPRGQVVGTKVTDAEAWQRFRQIQNMTEAQRAAKLAAYDKAERQHQASLEASKKALERLNHTKYDPKKAVDGLKEVEDAAKKATTTVDELGQKNPAPKADGTGLKLVEEGAKNAVNTLDDLDKKEIKPTADAAGLTEAQKKAQALEQVLASVNDMMIAPTLDDTSLNAYLEKLGQIPGVDLLWHPKPKEDITQTDPIARHANMTQEEQQAEDEQQRAYREATATKAIREKPLQAIRDAKSDSDFDLIYKTLKEQIGKEEQTSPQRRMLESYLKKAEARDDRKRDKSFHDLKGDRWKQSEDDRKEEERIATAERKAQEKRDELMVAQMEEGTAKEIATIHNDAKKKRVALEEEVRKEQEALMERQAQKWVDEDPNKYAKDQSVKRTKAKWYAQRGATTKDGRESLLGTFRPAAEAHIGYQTQQEEISFNETKGVGKALKDQLKAEHEALDGFLKEYGTFQQKKLAIARSYAEKIATATTLGEKMQLRAQQDKESKELEKSQFEERLGPMLANIDNLTAQGLQELQRRLRETMRDTKLPIDQLNTLADKLREVQRLLAQKRTNFGDFFRIPALDERRQRKQEAADTEATRAEAEATARDKRNGDLMARKGLSDTLAKGGVKVNPDELDASKADTLVKQVKIKDADGNVDEKATAEAQKKASKGFLTLASSEAEVLEANKNLANATDDAAQKQAAAVDTFDSVLATAIGMGEQASANANSAAEMSAMLFGENSGMAKATGALAELTSGATSAMKDLQAGNFVGVALDVLKPITSIANLLGLGATDSDKTLHDDMERLENVNEALCNAVEDLTDVMQDATLAEAGGVYSQQRQYIQQAMANTQGLMVRAGKSHKISGLFGGGESSSNHKINDRVSYGEWERVSAVVGHAVGSAAGFWQLTSEQMAKVARDAPDVYAKIKQYAAEGHDDASQFMDDYIGYYKQLEDLQDAYHQKITDTSFDDVAAEFKSMLADMNSSTDDFCDSFEKRMQQAVVNSLMAERYNDLIKGWYETFSVMMEDGDLSAFEQSGLKSQWDEIVDSALRERDTIKKAMGWTGSPTQQTSSRTLQGMTEDTAEAIEGRLTAMQISVESMRSTGQVNALSVAQINDSLLQVMREYNQFNLHYENIETQMAKCYIELRTISDNTGAVVAPIRSMQTDVAEMRRLIKNL